MTAARTLLQMAGADATPGPLSTAAVVVIDAQREYLDGRLPAGAAPALEAMQQLLRRARRRRPIIHVAHLGKAGGLFDPDGPGGQIADQVRPEPGETVITKGLPNAFAGTDLQSALKATGGPRWSWPAS